MPLQTDQHSIECFIAALAATIHAYDGATQPYQSSAFRESLQKNAMDMMSLSEGTGRPAVDVPDLLRALDQSLVLGG